VLTHVIRKRQRWHHLCEITANKRRAQANFDWVFYVAATVLLYIYRIEVLGFLSRFIEEM
jgi:hypothetical protein